jgi:hypothetical protein
VTRQDFEKAAVNLFTEEVAFSIFRRQFIGMSNLQDSKHLMLQNPEFALMLRHLPALAFVPIQNVQDYLVIVHFNYFWNFRVFSGLTVSGRPPRSCPHHSNLVQMPFFLSCCVSRSRQGRAKG